MDKRFSFRKKELPADKELFDEASRIYLYDKENGGLIWKEAKNKKNPGRTKIGSAVGGDDGHGYLMCMLLGHKFKVHQVVWLLNNGYMPKLLIDHIDRNTINNKIDNLRLASNKENTVNYKKESNTVGSKCDKGKYYRAVIEINGKKKTIGKFPSREDASIAYKEFHKEIHKDFSPY